jgi:uncharacterized protein (DUF2164 family)
MAAEIELSKMKRADAIASLKRYFEENMPEPLGDLPAGMLVDFFLEEIGPAVYNKAVSDAATRLQGRISDLEGELFVDEFGYWAKRKKRR